LQSRYTAFGGSGGWLSNGGRTPGDHAVGRKRDDEHEQGSPHFDLEAVCLLQASRVERGVP